MSNGVMLLSSEDRIKATPVPDFLIKSISEQGYSLEAAIADLIDNSVTANSSVIQVLVDTEIEPFQLFLADNGDGMSADELVNNMQFPSSNPEGVRSLEDLGRFGLGMKAASFSQTRKFTVISRKRVMTNILV
ncbi:ATP-binding protein [Pseudoalteromonas sp. Hal056]|uniref:ATP-binding protein n=1 Tax=Pseudoalteromonas sp. Hal056 TaxID=3035159 RepID=UPI00301B77E1